MEGKCKDCSWYKLATSEATSGYCHYNTPVVVRSEGQLQWPLVNEVDYCSKYEKRQETKNKQQMTAEEAKESWDRHRKPS